MPPKASPDRLYTSDASDTRSLRPSTFKLLFDYAGSQKSECSQWITSATLLGG